MIWKTNWKRCVPGETNFITLDVHGFSNNYMYSYQKTGTYKTEEYNKWIKYFPVEEVPTKLEYEIYENIDFNKPIELWINYVAREGMDIRNFDKSFIDMLFNRHLEVDDNIVESVHSVRVGSCSRFQDGKISFCIRNL